jgi:hypothetical protein
MTATGTTVPVAMTCQGELMDRARLDLGRLRAEMAARQEVMAKVVADVQARTRAEVERLHAAEAPPPKEQAGDDECDTQESWMLNGYDSAPESRSGTNPAHQAVVGKLESGELTWKDVFSDATRDPDARALRGFLDARLGEFQRVRNGR